MIIQHYSQMGYLEVSSKSGTYLYYPVERREYKLVKALLSMGAVGKAWAVLKQHECTKKPEESHEGKSVSA